MKGFRLHPSSFPGLCPVARVVYAKPPFGGPQQVLAYLGRYTHRVAIANSRLIALSEGKVCFTFRLCTSTATDPPLRLPERKKANDLVRGPFIARCREWLN
jgi:hypothetical protein